MVSTRMSADQVLYHRQAGGGGFGSALERRPEAVVNDVLDDRVSTEAAREMYGVVIDESTMQLDPSATQELRQKKS